MKVWVAAFYEDNGIRKFSLFTTRQVAMEQAAYWMLEEYNGNHCDACEGDNHAEFRTIDNFGGKEGLTKIVWATDGFFPGAPDVSVYEKEILE